ncbi:14873_t:CDS:10 [Entrophospora sp. SA101]|nr:14873_t:CDS:10 [Entrophospora sp. SA101]
MSTTSSTAAATATFNRSALEEVLKKRFFYAPSFQIYGGVGGLYDYGPAGCALQTNILDIWRKHFVLEEDMLEMDGSIMTLADVLKTSGHVDKFTDWMTKDVKTGDIFRADHLIENVLEKRLIDDKQLKAVDSVVVGDDRESVKNEYEGILAKIDNYTGPELGEIIRKHNIKSPETNNDLSEPVEFNLMFETSIGPTGHLKGNEISPRSGLLRVREFTMAEIEHYVDPDKKDHARFDEVKDIKLRLLPQSIQEEGKLEPVEMSIGEAVNKKIVDNQTLGYFLARIHLFLLKLGIKYEKLRFRQHMPNEMAHYACDCWDAEIQSSYGWIECVGCADRSAYDLTVHSNRTKEKLVVRERNVNKSDFKGLTIKLPEEDKAKFKKTISGDEYSLKKERYEFEVFQLFISNSNNQITLSNHKLTLKTMKEFEILLPNPKGADGGLTLSKRKPDRYFNVQLNYNLSNTKNKINNGVDKEGKSDNMLSKIPEHPPEIYIERKIVTPYQEIRQEYMKCYEAEHNKYLEKLEKKWKISRWNKRFKKHVKEEKKEMKKWRKEFQNAVMNSQKEFYEKLGELKLEGKEVKKEEEDDTNTWLENLKQKKRVRKEKEEQTKALETWRLEYSGLPRYKPPETWWAKNRDKIMKEAMKKIPPKKQK